MADSIKITAFGSTATDSRPTERNRRRRRRVANEKRFIEQTNAEGRAAHTAPQMRRQSNLLVKLSRNEKIQNRRRK